MNTTLLNLSFEVRINGAFESRYEKVLNVDAVRFLKALHQRFNEPRRTLLEQRGKVALGFDPSTASIRNAPWQVAPVPASIEDRRVEITGPTDRKMMINALNSGAKVFMADCEDSLSPTWENIMEGQLNLHDAVLGQLAYDAPNGKHYRVGEQPAVLFVRPRGLHLEEKHLEVQGTPMSASLVDFGLFVFNNATTLSAQGMGPFFYLPKLEHYKEAQWWNDVFEFSQDYLGIPRGTFKATVLVETLTASYFLDEILYALRDHSAGLNCGRWDYIFSYIKRTLLEERQYALPDRAQVGMTSPFLAAYTKRVVQVAHRRGAHAMGGMAAFIPIKNDAQANEGALSKVKADKLREVQLGHDGTWVAHPALVTTAMEVFDQYMPQANQLDVQPEGEVCAEDLVQRPVGTVTVAGVNENLSVGIQYTAAWLSGFGAAAINNLMEDAATAEISRTQLWHWLQVKAKTQEGLVVDHETLTALAEQQLASLTQEINPQWKAQLPAAYELFISLVLAPNFEPFLTNVAYNELV